MAEHPSNASPASADGPSDSCRVLVVDDEAHVLRLITTALMRAGMEVVGCESGEEGLRAALRGGFDVILLDACLPGIQGLDVARELREAGHTTPILMVTGLATTDFLETALEAGADDFVGKPFQGRELVARVRALRRRGKVVPTVTWGALSIDPVGHVVSLGANKVRLTGVELRILLALVRAGGEHVTPGDLLSTVWGLNFDPGTNLVYTHISNLRRKLATLGAEHVIQSARGTGYRVARGGFR